jgi:hypothetical protein
VAAACAPHVELTKFHSGECELTHIHNRESQATNNPQIC